MGTYEWWWHGPWFMWMFPLFFIIALIVVGLLMFRGFWRSAGRGAHEKGESALDILDKRFARGEIDRSTYDEMREALRH